MVNKYFIGIDIGGTKISGGLVKPGGEIVRGIKLATPVKGKAADILNTTHSVIKDLLEEGGVDLKDILGIGVAVPGVVDRNGVVVVTPNIGLGGIELKKILSKKYRTMVAVGNDVNFGVLGECWLGAGRKAKNIVGLFLGTGVGGGVIIDGKILLGGQGAAAELGHMTAAAGGPKCTCGNIGCVEAFVGRWAIERDIRQAIAQGERSAIVDIVGDELKQIKSGALKKALQVKDPLVCRIVKNASEALAQACVSLNHVFNPEVFILGGGVMEACGEYIAPIVEKALYGDPFFARLNAPKVLTSRLGDDAVILGAVAAARQLCCPKDLRDVSYYPKVELTPAGKVKVKGNVLGGIFFIRADGKVKEAGSFLPLKLTDRELEDICKKGPDVLIVACGDSQKVGLSSKAQKFLRKKKILPYILPFKDAVKMYHDSDERRTIVFYPAA